MERRSFLTTLFAAAIAGKATIGQKIKDAPLYLFAKKEIKITDNETATHTLVGDAKIILPANPEAITTVIHFYVLKTKWRNGPIILSNGQKVMGTVRDIIVEKEINLDETKHFTLQYLGPDIGWNLFT
ncbi:MAG: hypothetical protein A2504_06930 [Bdellovibrionales bacterium RIFOXYD12_FULL_39_22]|nr:MAG: hypothetical protein A2385_05145 [Bdellovibrionales bacterium RIFOXYB1_FULL_39_21]OFZ44308.1 MAG: hypothetical protein A2485_15925 [Bdellovibrionales bacterium RIFOXYC12_FULL_39_17]OFZ49163.1 MAG: hypothetical protein A2404_15865 [Bdellovibrionales bacterium RIFOXYC1_FULL_39_130]OFZ72239.1 MAG: hypothetical protein A2451_15770 [Bdellovibrionales bacterium RIFOXYC2_FULL_39_8]OFZ76971.1 MAG: hypothetical protein A2560_10950 [Bdellovibrionales bacterium RIFOXYD1_FULL_39_84]OFZ95184.1 MAG: